MIVHPFTLLILMWILPSGSVALDLGYGFGLGDVLCRHFVLGIFSYMPPVAPCTFVHRKMYAMFLTHRTGCFLC